MLLNQHSELEQRIADASARPLHPVDHLHHTRSVLLPDWASRHSDVPAAWVARAFRAYAAGEDPAAPLRAKEIRYRL